MEIGLTHYLIVSAILFALGLYGIVSRKHAVMVLMGLELILNAANINFIAFARYGGMNIDGQIAAIFVIILAAAEAAVALAILLNIYQHFKHVNVDEVKEMKE
ncbi:MAG: NADH dehydrogenase subunit K [Bacteroidetes bacterium]|jgi:NADH-quinone oxidoreductase subunit K|nr:MAG: NADH dehydrogenase subunit K [Bacteroidota bacterium]